MKINCRISAGALAIGLAGAAFGQDALPPMQSYGGVAYLTGGIGLDESEAIKAAEKNFALSLLFAQNKRGEYLAGVKVRITDSAGKNVLETVTEGPMLLARLPAGAYKISAEHDGVIVAKTVRVNAQGVTRATFVWRPTGAATIE